MGSDGGTQENGEMLTCGNDSTCVNGNCSDLAEVKVIIHVNEFNNRKQRMILGFT